MAIISAKCVVNLKLMSFLDFIFPKSCLECGKEGSYICGDCLNKVLDGTFDENNFSIFKYKGVIKKAIISLKYKFATDISNELIEVSINRLKSKKIHNITLVPIPLHWQKENRRGFNQAELLAKKLSETMKWDFLSDLLVKQKQNMQQAGLRGVERAMNVLNVFVVNSKYLNDIKLKNKKVVIFDDVYTTGSTVLEAKQVLTKSGFQNVYSLTIAR